MKNPATHGTRSHDMHGPDKIVFQLHELPGLVGRTFVGEWRAIPFEAISEFDRATLVNDEEAGYSFEDYPDGMLEGLHTLGTLLELVDTGFHIHDFSAMGLVYGFNRVRFTQPVMANQRIRVHGTIVEVVPRGPGFLVTLDCTVELEGHEKPAYVAEFLVLWQPTQAVRTTAGDR